MRPDLELEIRKARGHDMEELTWQVDGEAGVLYRSLTKQLPLIDRSEGVFLYDREGKRYLDGSSGALVVNIGHGNKRVLEAMRRQAEKVTFAHSSQFTNAPAEMLARKLTEYSPSGLNRVFFSSGGSEAVESALKASIQYHYERGKGTKRKIITVCPSYHGGTLGALSATCREDLRGPYEAVLLDFPKIRAPHPERDPDCAWDLEALIKEEGKENIAAFMIEPVGGTSTGAMAPSKEYFQRIREICDRNDILFIVDEVMAGIGRTGEFFAINHFGVIPDIIATSKGLGSGYIPLGCIIVHDKVFQAFQGGSGRFCHGFTYQANPLACAVGLEVIKVIEDEKLLQNARHMGVYLKMGLEVLSKKYNVISGVRGMGLMLALALRNEGTEEKSLGESLVDAALKNGLVIFGGLRSENSDFVMIAPPLIIKKDEVDLLIELLGRAFDGLGQERKSLASDAR